MTLSLSSCLLFGLSFSSLLHSTFAADTMRIPLSRRASSSTPGAPIDWASHRQSRASVERRFGGFTAPLRKREHRTESNGPRWRPIPSSKKRTNTPTSPRINLSDSFVKNPAGPLDSQFSATFSFGTPPQQANLMIDLGSSDMVTAFSGGRLTQANADVFDCQWVASDCQTNCPAGASYNPNASSTSRANGDFSVSYGQFRRSSCRINVPDSVASLRPSWGPTSVRKASDRRGLDRRPCRYGPSYCGQGNATDIKLAHATVSNQQFGAASSLTYDWAKSEISGIIGLAVRRSDPHR